MTAELFTRWTAARKESWLLPIIRGVPGAYAAALAEGFTGEEIAQGCYRLGKYGQAGLSQTRLQALRAPAEGVA